ncbi:Myb-like DNA-binding domain containing protein [Trichomonas vaginalis G3]|uniref:Myb-like DNA-binding domain containing protein n=1 Tax=Trichomonas vaginalis (strain ATCC PRA-98 / G3) TaxID=412133 RepID=A2FZ52_TRIV3|nr:RNA polymerase II transcription regulator recruiting protein [Trichomonas vaginalis G3]EAX89823.1 Myb-like DNA-binding domain containing protein [Trichomonas vaginalis G3]KAI5512601.1 RNA polymerase II transcription regulator recruiting protein [Trichomonas vaginalis G3]|eukprot:XP_001302753.1 Myb-like DNA-binding domain containing protein [Trichomonas vaginalis G3]
MSLEENHMTMMPQATQAKRGKNKFTLAEDAALQTLVKKYGECDWSTISRIIRTKNSRQCHDRWFYYLTPKLNRGPFTEEEDNKLVQLEKKYGQHWVKIAKHFSGRTDTQIKNRWNVLKRRIENEKPIPIQQIAPIQETKIEQTQKTIVTPPGAITQRLFENLFEFEDLDSLDDPFASVF